MSDQGDEGEDKQFEATPEKLRQAREKGDIVRSQDLLVFATYAGFYLCLAALAPSVIPKFARTLSYLLANTDSLASANGGDPSAAKVAVLALASVAPFFAVPFVLVVLMVVAQHAFLVTPANLRPKLSKISPLSNFKKKFGRSGLFGFGKSLVKLCIYSTLLFIYVLRKVEILAGSVVSAPAPIMARLGSFIVEVTLFATLVALVMGGIDYLWQRQEHARKNRMSHKDMRDENKNSEGDPAVKAQRRQRGQEIAMNQMLAEVPSADVIIVNPTHFAVALRWERGGEGAPRCIAKGVDEVAAQIRKVASDANIPLHSDPPAARALHAATEIGEQIAPEHYRAVAAAIRFADEMRAKARQR